MSNSDAPRGASATASGDDDDDPIVASYNVFIKPALPANRKLVVLQYVNKTSQDPSNLRAPRISEVRVKPGTGMYEVDVPIDTSEAGYDRNKGVIWGTSLQKTMEIKKGGSLGLAGGFNVGAPSARGGGAGGRGGRRGGAGGGGDDDDSNVQLSWAEAARQGKVLQTQTLIGGSSAEDIINKMHMVGVFQGKNIHLTPVSSLVHLRPAAHHLDAAVEQERLNRASTATAPVGSAPDKSAGRAIHMTLKAAMDDDGVATETMADRLRSVQTEPWRQMEWVHDEAEAAWEAYNECLLLRSGKPSTTTNPTPAAKDDSEKDKSKGKEIEIIDNPAETNNDDSGAPDLAEKVPLLKTDWNEDQLLRAVSGIGPKDKKPGEEAVSAPGPVRSLPGPSKAKKPAAAVKVEKKPAAAEETKRGRPGRPARSTATAATRAGRAPLKPDTSGSTSGLNVD
ncbi:DNA-directed RNA polymerase-like protein [Podospora didyma]|uniref:DNA-directed RNA polymerase-like protein n=1 Tax=Podospora didyma TaxID=330526 RepID=A0AAE0NZR2_9PEZI|nr:DNA-directed RNA polymerase-like protein [Podospora didyma]